MPKRRKVPRDDQWSEGDVANVLCNPLHVYMGTVSAEQWIKAMVRLSNEQGLEQTLRRIAAVYDEALGAKGHMEDELAEKLVGFNKLHLPLEELFAHVLAGLKPPG